MDHSISDKAPSFTRLIMVPGLITLAVTILRVVGELRRWPRPWFDPNSGIVGITWLIPIFGIYFAIALARRGEGPAGLRRALSLALLGMGMMFTGLFAVWNILKISLFGQLIILCLIGALAAAIQVLAWSGLFRTLLAYGYAARVPVVVVMLAAMWGNWGTHYDYTPQSMAHMAIWEKWLWLALFPQLVFWVGFTIVVGMLFGVIAAAIARGFERTVPSGSEPAPS